MTIVEQLQKAWEMALTIVSDYSNHGNGQSPTANYSLDVNHGAGIC